MSCNNKGNSNETGNDKRIFIDDFNREVEVPKQIKRIFALSPALTEMLFFICPDSLIAARTQACNYPKDVFEKPEINTYPIDIEKILSIKPDIILTEEGISSHNQLKMLANNDLAVYSFKYSKMEDVFEAMLRISEICNCKKKAQKKIEMLKEQYNKLSKDKLRNQKVLALVWRDPIYVFGKNTLLSDQLTEIGLENAVDSIFKQAYPEISREYFLKVNPDIIIGSTFKNLDTTLFERYPELKRTIAYKKKMIFDIEDDILTRPGPRSVLAMQMIKDSISNE